MKKTWEAGLSNEKSGLAHAPITDNAFTETINNLFRYIGVPESEISISINTIRTDG